MCSKGYRYFKVVLFFFTFFIAHVRAAEKNEVVFRKIQYNSDFLKQADQIKQFLVSVDHEAETYHILTKKGELFRTYGKLTSESSNLITKSVGLPAKHDIKMFAVNNLSPSIFLNSNNQLLHGDTLFSKRICESTPYRLEILSLKKDKKGYLVASSWPNIHFVEESEIKYQEPLASRLKGMGSKMLDDVKSIPRKAKRAFKKFTDNDEKMTLFEDEDEDSEDEITPSVTKCTLKNAYLLDVGQAGDDQYIIYAHVEKNATKPRAKDFISRFRNVRTDYPIFTIKKWTIKKESTFENIVAFVTSENQKNLSQTTSNGVTITIEDKDQEKQVEIPNVVPTTLCTIQNVPVDGSHVPFIIDYRNDNQWAVVCKKKDGYYLKINDKDEEPLLNFVLGKDNIKPTVLAIQCIPNNRVLFYCKEGFGKSDTDALSESIVLNDYSFSDSKDNGTKRTLTGCFADQNNIYLLFVERYRNVFYNAINGIQKFIVQRISKNEEVEPEAGPSKLVGDGKMKINLATANQLNICNS